MRPLHNGRFIFYNIYTSYTRMLVKHRRSQYEGVTNTKAGRTWYSIIPLSHRKSIGLL